MTRWGRVSLFLSPLKILPYCFLVNPHLSDILVHTAVPGILPGCQRHQLKSSCSYSKNFIAKANCVALRPTSWFNMIQFDDGVLHLTRIQMLKITFCCLVLHCAVSLHSDLWQAPPWSTTVSKRKKRNWSEQRLGWSSWEKLKHLLMSLPPVYKLTGYKLDHYNQSPLH